MKNYKPGDKIFNFKKKEEWEIRAVHMNRTKNKIGFSGKIYEFPGCLISSNLMKYFFLRRKNK